MPIALDKYVANGVVDFSQNLNILPQIVANEFKVPDVRRNLFSLVLCQQNHRLFCRVCQAEFIEDVGVSARDVSNQYLSLKDLRADLIEDWNGQNFMISALHAEAVLLLQMAAEIEIKEIQFCPERHHDETKRLVDHRRHSSLVYS